MWVSDVESYAAYHSISIKQASFFQCTGEHLVAHCDGGRANRSNIVAACKFCNTKRHCRKRPEDPVSYAFYVQRRLNKGSWNNHLLNVAARGDS
ncbi:HNH endonuclease [Marinobacter sp. SS13-12]|uniref:HNH endonuclease n=1 Tax=Marinobacter sp. SS13-12 TaxID=3050451 RepID=UPI002553CDF6|nr:HNH endonuclease [Marinobacter sp. SS13-12]MDK8463079.1 HNH endonuclease [Marinobacter sp. SS13-12]